MIDQKMQMAIYRIDKELFDQKQNKKIINTIINKYNSEQSPKEQFGEQKIQRNIFNKHDLTIYYCESDNTPNWRDFFILILSQNEKLLKGRNHNIAFLAFISNKDNIYVLCGGRQAYHCIRDYIDNNFGLEILSRLVSRNSKVIKEATDREVVGSILGSVKFFRDTYTFYDDEEFGKFYKQIKAELNKSILTREFYFDNNDLRNKTGCIAKSSFQINKAINFECLENILTKIQELLAREPNFSINKVKLISKRIRKNKALINELEDCLYDVLYQHVTSGNNSLDFDLCHNDFEQYLTASRYALFKGSRQRPQKEYAELSDIKFLFNELSELGLLVTDDKDSFKNSVESIFIESYDENSEIKTSKAPLIKLVHGEVSLDGQPYFYLDSDWYEIQKDFITELNDNCGYILSTCLQNTLLPKVFVANSKGKYIEDDYIEQYYKGDGILLLHKIKYHNIELCDILKYTKDATYLVHVKRGFNNSVRDLVSQIEISAKRINEDIKSAGSCEFLEGIYSSLSSSQNSKNPKSYMEKVYSQNISKKKFLSLFKKKIHCCFAIVDDAGNDREISQIDQFNSNIAKCSLVALHNKLRNLRFDLKVIQIFRDL